MQTRAIVLAAFATSALAVQTAHAQAQTDAPMSFFVTSTTHSGDLGGLAGADAECQNLAAAVGAGGRTWRAYLSTTGTQTEPAVNARDRIGDGPWHNANGVMIAASLADLHGDIERDRNLIYRATALTENGDLVFEGLGGAAERRQLPFVLLSLLIVEHLFSVGSASIRSPPDSLFTSSVATKTYMSNSVSP